ncbi:MAG: leucine-rich repeat domain-containing protein [Muribaculaceae bacterium]|nr:leucine-rich repeat domain-containing protein [Muribaculaceae bacterium]
MKKFMILAVSAFVLAGTVQAKVMPQKVQGIPYSETLKKGVGKKIAPAWEWDPNPAAPALPENEFTFDDIQSWTGEGENRAALVIQWNDPRETHAIVFGYRWDGLATGADMIRAVVAANPRLYGLIQYTNVSSPTDPLGGYTINGFGWDADSNGEIELYDSGKDEYHTAPDGLFIHPRGYNPELGGSSDYDYDNWKAVDTNDLWKAGWYIGYWSYWVKDSADSNFSYSGWGASGRVLQDGSWDGWNYANDMMASDWKEFKAAPSTIPEGAKTEFESNGLYFSLTDYESGKVKLVNPSALTSIENPSAYTGVIVIPSEFVDEEKTYTVTEIDADAFKESTVTSVTLPATIGKIGANAFADSSLSEIKGAEGVDISASIKSLGAYAFSGCQNLTAFFLPGSLTAVPEGLYKGCGLTSVEIPETIVTLGASSFENNTSLISLDIPASVTEIGENAFAGCTALQTIKVNSVYPPAISENTFSESVYPVASLQIPSGFEDEYKAKDGWKNFTNIEFFNIPVNNGDIFSTDNVTYKVVITEDSESVKITYPKIDGKPTRDKIKEANQLLTGDIVIPEKITYMGKELEVTEMNDSAFYYANNITSLIINAKLTAIPNQAFANCEKLASVTLPESVKSIGEWAFSYAGLESIVLPEGLESLGSRVFFQCQNLTSVNIPTSLKQIPTYCFSYCKALTQLAFGDQVETIEGNAMQNCSALTSVVLPKNLVKIADYTLQNCSSLEMLEIPESVTSIGSSAFKGCSKLVVSLPASLETLGTEALAGVANETIEIPETITALPNSLFSGNKNLKVVQVSDNVTSFGNSVFQNCAGLTMITVKNQEGVQTYAEEEISGISFPSKLTSIGSYCFQGCSAITSVEVPEGVTTVGQSLFYRCANLEEVVLPNSVKTLQSGMFQECKKLKKLTLGSSITSIPSNFVRDCNDLEWVIISGDEENAVAGKLELPETVTTIASWTFANCKKLTEVSIPSKVTRLEMNTFDGCEALAKVTIPDGLTYIGNYVFRNTALTELEIPASVTSMSYASDVVYGCPDIKVYICNAGAPQSISGNAWRVATGVYAPVMVPVGKKTEYEAANNWKNSQISEPEAIVSFTGEETENGSTEKADLSVEVNVEFDTALPERFRIVNEDLLMDEAEFELHWRLGEEIPSDSQNVRRFAEMTEAEEEGEVLGDDETDEDGDLFDDETADDDFEKVSLELNSEHKAVVSIDRPSKDTMLETKVHVIHTSGEYNSEITKIAVKGSGVQTGIENIEVDSYEEGLYYDLNGLPVARPEKGIYINVRNGKAEKRNL